LPSLALNRDPLDLSFPSSLGLQAWASSAQLLLYFLHEMYNLGNIGNSSG
jgi:hypothetical protein